MKSYKETTDSIFEKSASVKAQRKKKTTVCISAVICVTAVFSAAVLHAGSANEQTGNPSVTMEPVHPETDMIIHFNEIQEPLNSRMDIVRSLDDRVVMSGEELEEYYGTAIFPKELPEGFDSEIFRNDITYGDFSIYRNNERGVYYDQNTIAYLSRSAKEAYKKQGYLDDTMASLMITLSKVRKIYWFESICDLTGAEPEKSYINGEEVYLCHYADANGEHFSACFENDDVSFEIDGNLIPAETFVHITSGYFKK